MWLSLHHYQYRAILSTSNPSTSGSTKPIQLIIPLCLLHPIHWVDQSIYQSINFSRNQRLGPFHQPYLLDYRLPRREEDLIHVSKLRTRPSLPLPVVA